MKGTAVRLGGASALLAAAWLALAPPARAQASPFVPVWDAAYQDLDVLLARGMVGRRTPGSPIRGQRPYSRMAFARAVAEARSTLGDGAVEAKPRVAEAMVRLEARFAAELALVRAGERPGVGRSVALRQVTLDATAADSPPRAIPWQLTSALDADVNPLLQRNHGRVLADGLTLGSEAWVDAVLGSRVAAQFAPRLWAEDGGGARADGTLLLGHVRALFGNLSVEVGRNALGHGHAREAGPALSSNPRGLDLLRLSMERPGRLPWIFRGLGPAGFTALLADMGRDQDTPGSKLVVFEGAVRPHPNLELGGILLNHQGGGVDPGASFGERVLDALFILPRRPFYFFSDESVMSDKAAGVDLRLTLPERGLELFVEMLTTDDHDLFRAPRQGLWHDAAWTAGARATALGGEGRWDAWLEASRVGLLPYTHHEFTSGLTLDRRVLGSPLGPLGTGVQAGAGRIGERGTLSVEGAWERYSGDTYRNPDDGLSHRFRVADNPDEIRLRGAVEWAGHPGVPGLSTGVRLGWERVTRFALGSASRTNLVAQVRAAYSW
ncbi:MAG TPA: capsule assembly Wzi family protein [Longimicrobiales bacterium]|nr:capsule assembly Wzi family protein [Longimicrobiales bacterium]